MMVTGTLRATRGGFAFLQPDEGGEDLLVRDEDLGGAIHGDRVRAVLLQAGERDFRARGRIDEILERTHPDFTGDVFRRGRGYFVRPDSPLLPERLSLRGGADPPVAGAKILFEVRNEPGRSAAPYAVLRQMLGEAEDPRLDPIVIASEYNLDLRFSDAALDEAEAAARTEHLPDDARRRDLRDELVFTIDPADAKDFDDAISVRRLVKDGTAIGWELTVHIADVTAYVAEDGPLDLEARERGTSVYFPGTVVPMLPEVLSSGVASLSPESEKRALSVRIRYDTALEVQSTEMFRSWIRSDARFHYEQALAIVESHEGPGGSAKSSASNDSKRARKQTGEARETETSRRSDASGVGPVSDVHRMLLDAAELAEKLRKRRFAQGGFELDVPETEMALAGDGVPKRLWRRTGLRSHHWIEEFMIAANRATGRWALDRDWPYLFRVHEPPSPRAMEEFAATVAALRPAVDRRDLAEMPRLRRWLRELPEDPVTRMIHRFFLRAMQKAVYAPGDLGHFGLGIEAYCHFTSPIRRYPDLYDHRRIKELIDQSEASPDELGGALPALAERTSRAEQNAEAAEREMARLKMVRYAETRLGREGKGFVTGVTPRGLFVELAKVPIEGFVPAAGLGRSAQFDPDHLSWIEPRSGWYLRPGDPVVVQLVHVDLRLRRIELALVSARRRDRSGVPGAQEPRRRGRGRGRPERPGRRKGGKGRKASAAGERRSRGDASRHGSGTGKRSKPSRKTGATRGGSGKRPSRGRPKRGRSA